MRTPARIQRLLENFYTLASSNDLLFTMGDELPKATSKSEFKAMLFMALALELNTPAYCFSEEILAGKTPAELMLRLEFEARSAEHAEALLNERLAEQKPDWEACANIAAHFVDAVDVVAKCVEALAKTDFPTSKS